MNARDDKNEDQAAVIRDDIERSRANLTSTVNQIEERLSPAHLKEQVADLKENVLGQLHEAKEQVKDDLVGDLHEVKDKVRGEIAEAKTAAYDATVGKVSHMVEDARETVTEAGTTVLGTIRANPIPAALIAVGVGWLFMSARSNRVARLRYAQPYGGEELDLYAGYVGEIPDTERDLRGGPRRVLRKGQQAISRVASTVGGGVSNVGHRVTGGASSVGHRVADGASTVGHRVADRVSTAGHRVASGASNVGRTVAQGASTVGHRVVEGASSVGHVVADRASAVAHGAASAAHQAGDRAGHLVEGARTTAIQVAGNARTTGRRVVRGAGHQLHRAEETLEGAFDDNPMAFGAVALAVGAAVGLALPHTTKEDEWMGPTKEALLERAQTAAQDAIHRVEERVGQVASVAGAAQDTLQKAEEGLGSDKHLGADERRDMVERDVKGSIGKTI